MLTEAQTALAYCSNAPLLWTDKRLRRFWDKVAIIPFVECWLWIGATDPCGYGQFFINGKSVQAHRVSYALHYGCLPLLTLDHLCKVRNCVRPDHTEDVSLRENIRRGDGPAARRHREIAQTQTCLRGHIGRYKISGGKLYCRGCS